MKRFIVSFVLFLPLLFACQSNNSNLTGSAFPSTSLYLDHQFIIPPLFNIESEQEIFMLDDEMRFMVENNLNNTRSHREKAMRLLKHIFSEEDIALSYSNNANLIARDTYHRKIANCMSLTILAYALAEKANLNVEFQQVDIPEYWVRNGQYNLLTGHINLLIKPIINSDKRIILGNDNIQIDFDPYISKQTFIKRKIGKNTVLAMFYNNKGGQALVDNQYDIAYQYFKAATQADHKFSPAWGNLAVLYRLTNSLIMAEKVYRHAIFINPKNLTSLANLAILLRSQHKYLEADDIEKQLLFKRRKNPYYHAVLADESYYQQDYSAALKHFKQALKLKNNVHEFYFGLAKVYYQMNRLSEAKRAMQKALSLNKAKSTEHQYIAKLNFLKAEISH